MKSLALCCILLFAAAWEQPALAELTDAMPPMPWFAQLGICGACLSILAWVCTRTIPRTVEKCNEAVKEAAHVNAASLDRLTEAMGENTDRQLDLLREVLTKKDK